MTSILPTPIQAAARRPQNQALLRIYIAYRALLSLLLLIMLFSPNTRQLVGSGNADLYAGVALAYLASSAPLLGAATAHLQQRQDLLLLIFLVDIVAITLLSDASGGMSSGLPVLLVVTSAASAVLVRNRALATLVAALCVLAILFDTLRLISNEAQGLGALFPAGLLGLLIFFVSILVQIVAQRLGRVEELARNRASDLYDLQRLNEQIVQHMKSGILLVSASGDVRAMNKAAHELLLPGRGRAQSGGLRLADYSPHLAEQYAHWQASGRQGTRPFSVADGAPQVIASFLQLEAGDGNESLVLVEDYTPVTQHAQSLKVGSLGRLAASIAHEIRNPLGAISHAAQLLQESPDLAPADRRMADIVNHHCARVNDIVENVMQISRNQPPQIESLDLVPWLEDFTQNYLDALGGEAEVEVSCAYRDLRVDFDQENLSRVLGNLLDNALRHSRLLTGRETAALRAQLDFGRNQVLLDVIDHGSGVPECDQANLFEPFFTTVEEGSGMGLYLCKELCEINGADLQYLRTEEGQSCFRIRVSQPPL